ncbi:hypothetical protein ACFFMN_02640 [Planobispora siamensis]|uniref:GAF domain-containing protein n=1 Tax=Planobispora siamensis TaxID=936338 RepID=A0A8J3SF27_9ACTN|nr:hypothetical protein [Planobispora siamensis]GIH93053.1 hypothetical protein Psi01_36830 [Planobispora siamensis]
MFASQESRAFEQEILRFQQRLSQLRESRSLVDGSEEVMGLMDAALLELDVAFEELRVRQEEINESTEQLLAAQSTVDEEKRLLHSAFVNAPVPILLLEGEGAVIRRASLRALQLLDVSHAYAVGRPFPVFVDLKFRAALRSALAAVCRTDAVRTVRSRVIRRRLHPVDLTLAMTRLDVQGAARTMTLVVIPLAEGIEGTGGSASEREATVEEYRDQAERGDLISAFTRQLLSEDMTLRQVGQTLLDHFADWIFIDLAGEGEQWRREVVLHRDRASGELLRSVSGPAELSRRVRGSGQPFLGAHLDDPSILGRDDDGICLATRLGAGSLICVPLAAGNESFGAVTAVRRTGVAGAFSLAEAGLFEELCGHLALWMKRFG